MPDQKTSAEKLELIRQFPKCLSESDQAFVLALGNLRGVSELTFDEVERVNRVYADASGNIAAAQAAPTPVATPEASVSSAPTAEESALSAELAEQSAAAPSEEPTSMDSEPVGNQSSDPVAPPQEEQA